MQVHFEPSFNGYAPGSVQVRDRVVVDRLRPGVPCRADRSGRTWQVHVGRATVIDLPGPLVREAPAHALLDRVAELLHQGARNFAINLEEVDHADSYGLGGLAAAYNLIDRAGGKVKFFAAPEGLLRTLARLRLDTVFELFHDEISALSSFAGQDNEQRLAEIYP
jgi:anti-sigma B factor antagonist